MILFVIDLLQHVSHILKIIYLILNILQTVPNYERVVVFRLGRICPPKGPGVILVLPLIDQWQRVDLRTRAFNIPPCQVKYLNIVTLILAFS